MPTLPVDGSHRDAVNTVGVPIKVAVVIARSTVATGKDVNVAKPVATLLDGVEHGPSDQNPRCLHRPAVVRRAPRARVDVVVDKVVV